MSRVKNRAPGRVQITAEQLLRDARESQASGHFRPPKQRAEDVEELSGHRARKRGEFEERVRRSKGNIKEWVRYADWEASQNEFDRSRSVFERALDTHPTLVQMWLAYMDMELKGQNIQHARNLLDRAVTLLPRVDQLWYKYVYLEELMGNVSGARQIFERWMTWEPEAKVWHAYIKLEERYGEFDRASLLYERLLVLQPSEATIWAKWAKFEEERGNIDKAREVFKMAFEFFGEDPEGVEKAQPVYESLAKMETRLKEYERARVAYKYALGRVPQEKGKDLNRSYASFEKQHGAKDEVDESVLAMRRLKYEDDLGDDSRNYDTWLDYARLEEEAWKSLQGRSRTPVEEGDSQGKRTQEIYERAIAQVPLGKEKRDWRRYIFVWLKYAIFEEVERKDYDRAREVYKVAIHTIPHKSFTFSKLWLMFAKFEIRRLDLGAARKILGTAIGVCPKPSLFKRYIELEIELREFDRARILYEKYLEFDPSSATGWVAYAELEAQLADPARARGIYELALTQNLSMPEILWKSYIDFEVNEQGNREAARTLYERLITLNADVKVWGAYALFEGEGLAVSEETEDGEEVEKVLPGDMNLARGIFKRGYDHFKLKGLKKERLSLLEDWEAFEMTFGSPEGVEEVKRLKPTGGIRRLIDLETGQTRDVHDLIFPDDEETNTGPSKFLQMAQAWKESQERDEGGREAE